MTSVALYHRFDSRLHGGVFDAIVIGSGISGLASAAMLSRAGKRVLVLERHAVPGGLTHTFRRGGFEWDVGLHYLGKVHDGNDPLRRVFDYVTNEGVRWAPMADAYDRIVCADRSYEFLKGEDALRSALSSAFPDEDRAIRQYLKSLHVVRKRAELFFVQRVLPRWAARLGAPVLEWPFRRYAKRTTRETLSRFGASPRLAGVLAARWGNYGLPPGQSSYAMHALVAEFYLEGASYPEGGAASLFNAIAPVIRSGGGAIAVHAEVDRVLIEKGGAVGVRMKSGEELRAPTVLSTVGARETMNRLLSREDVPAGTAEGLGRVHPSVGHVGLYLGLNGSAEDLGLSATNQWICASYDHDATARASRQDPGAPFPVVFIDSPTAKDPRARARAQGRSTVIAVAPAPFSWFSEWQNTGWQRRGQSYADFKETLKQRLRETVYATFPKVRGRIAVEELSTPLSTAHFCNHENGAMYGLEHSPQRFRERWLGVRTPVRNLYLAGQDIVTVGVGASLMSAVLASSVILNRNLMNSFLS